MTLDSLIEESKEELIASLQELVRIPSVGGGREGDAPFGKSVQGALDYSLKLAERMGFSTVNHDNMVGYAEYGQGEEMIAVLAHLDVVPEGEGWTYPPYGAEIHEGRIWGRGTLDDKGAAIAALYGLKAIRELQLPLKRRIRVIFGTNEERGSKCIEHYNKVDEQPVAGFTPDADYPIIFAEKGTLNTVHTLKLQKDAGAAGAEKDEKNGQNAVAPRLLSLKGGTVVNAVPGEAKALLSAGSKEVDALRQRLKEAQKRHEKIAVAAADPIEGQGPDQGGGRFLVTAEGVSAHGSVPWMGENAVITLLEYLAEVLEEGEERSMCRFLLKVLGRETDGASLGIRMEDEISGGLSVNAGIFSFEDGEARLSLDIRYPVTKRREDFVGALGGTFAEGGFSTELVGGKEPLYVKEDSPLIKSLQKVYREKTGLEPELLAIGGGTYAKEMKNIVAFGPLFPGEEDTAHQADESIAVESLMMTAKIIAAAMAELAQ